MEKRVLYINSYHRGYAWSDGIEDGIREGLGLSIDITSAYLDAKRPDHTNLVSIQKSLIEAKLKEKPVDVIITSDNAAFDFVIENRDGIFKGIPLVACGLNFLTNNDLEPYTDLTAVGEIGDPLRNIELGLKLFPQTQEIHLVNDSFDGRAETVLESVRRTYGDQYKIRTTTASPNDSTESIIESINATRTPKIIIQFGVSPETGLNLDAYSSRNADISKVPHPIFVTFEASIVSDILGGACQDPKEQGRITAGLAIEILNGTSVNDIPPVLDDIEKLVFNHKALQKFSLSPSSLPEGSVIINAPEDNYIVFRKYLVIALWIILVLTIVLTVLIYEIVRRKNAERNLVQAIQKVDEASKAKSNFMMVMSHELLTPLNGIIGFSSLLEGEEDEDAKDEHIKDIQSQSNVLLGLIKRILEFTNYDSVSTKRLVVQPKPLIKKWQSHHQPKAEQKGLFLKTSVSGNKKLQPFLNDELLDTVLELLIDNAIKFSDKGTISVEMKLPLKTVHKKGVLEIRVSDEGIGISDSNIHHIFEPFHLIDDSVTRKFGGVGLGLATCKKLMDSIDGKIICESEVGAGTTFILRIPCEFEKKRRANRPKENSLEVSV